MTYLSKNHMKLEDLEREAYVTQNTLALEIYQRWGGVVDEMCVEHDDELLVIGRELRDLQKEYDELQKDYDALEAEHFQMMSPLERERRGED